MSLIRVENITREFITGEVSTKVLYGVSFTIDSGEFLAIMGPSGSGKSTLMHILGFLDKASSGKFFYKDKDVSNLSEDELARMRNQEIGFVFQAFHLLPKMSVLENVKLPLIYSKKKNQDQLARQALEAVGLSHRLHYSPNQISGGEKQRVAIARALVNEPAVVFADEPTGNLDSKSGQQVMAVLQALNEQGKTIVLVTHEKYTSQHAKRIITIRDGVIESDKSVASRLIAREEKELIK
jgi:putative ABC transport system ATP-binding protein